MRNKNIIIKFQKKKTILLNQKNKLSKDQYEIIKQNKKYIFDSLIS